jgi:nucleotide-binding universal stress UspA family protein
MVLEVAAMRSPEMLKPEKSPVVVGVNGTPAGSAAVRLGAREAMARGRPLRVVHAFSWPRRGEDRDYATARHDASTIVAEAVDTATRITPLTHVTGEVIDGPPIQVLLRRSRAAELLVLGDDDLAMIDILPFDSLLYQIVSRAWCPVVVSRGLRPPNGSLLVAVDGSAAALRALRLAASEARMRSLAVEVAHVVAEPGPGAAEAGQRLLDAALAAVPELPSPRARLLSGDPAAALIRASRHSRLVIVGPRGAGGSKTLGRVAGELLRRSAAPTVFVHARPTRRRSVDRGLAGTAV